jgi:hypothetical protein
MKSKGNKTSWPRASPETWEGGEFTAWRANVGCSLAHPTNPDAVVGNAVGRDFDDGYFEGEAKS